jgi:hypothetical protein
MGLEFIQKKAKRTVEKSWLDRVNQLKLPSLFDLPLTDSKRQLTVRLNDRASNYVQEGSDVVVQQRGNQLIVSASLREVGVVDDPPADVLALVHSHAGIVEGRVFRMSFLGDTMEVELK